MQDATANQNCDHMVQVRAYVYAYASMHTYLHQMHNVHLLLCTLCIVADWKVISVRYSFVSTMHSLV